MDVLDRRNFLVGVIACVIVSACVLVAAVVAAHGADRLRIERERTEQARVAACERIESPEVAALCIAAVKP